MGARPGQAVTVLAEPDPWPTEALILIRDGESVTDGTIRNRVAFCTGITNNYVYVDEAGRRCELLYGVDQITDYEPMRVVLADAVDALLDVSQDSIRRIREFRASLDDHQKVVG